MLLTNKHDSRSLTVLMSNEVLITALNSLQIQQSVQQCTYRKDLRHNRS